MRLPKQYCVKCESGNATIATRLTMAPGHPMLVLEELRREPVAICFDCGYQRAVIA